MVPFRIFDRESKQLWVVLNFHPNSGKGGQYLVAKEDDSNGDGEMALIDVEEIVKYRLVDFLDAAEE